MGTVNSVTGPLAVDQLGFTLMHEHVVTSSAGIWTTYPELMGDIDEVERATAASLQAARAGGVSTLVDLTTLDLGRHVRLLERVSRASGMQIVATTGIWLDIPRVMRAMDPGRVAAAFIRELTEGIEKTGIRAGVIKVANDREGVTDAGRVILQAAAEASLATGAPIMTHTYAPGRVGEQQAAVFEQAGLDPARVVIGHSNDTTDLDYLRGILHRGFYLGLDRFPGRVGPDARGRIAVIQQLLDDGFQDRLILSHDHLARSASREEDRARHDEYNPDGFLFITRQVLPAVAAGTGEDWARRLMVDNPRRLFAGGTAG